MIPATLWRVFSARWVDMRHAPADAPDWLDQGYLRIVAQGKLHGYTIVPPANSRPVFLPVLPEKKMSDCYQCRWARVRH